MKALLLVIILLFGGVAFAETPIVVSTAVNQVVDDTNGIVIACDPAYAEAVEKSIDKSLSTEVVCAQVPSRYMQDDASLTRSMANISFSSWIPVTSWTREGVVIYGLFATPVGNTLYGVGVYAVTPNNLIIFLVMH